MLSRYVSSGSILALAFALFLIAHYNAPYASAANYQGYWDTGDVQCDGDVDPVDSLQILRYDAGLSTTQNEPCPEVGEAVSIVHNGSSSSHVTWYFGDVNCDGLVNTTDSSRILRYDAGYHDPGCGKVLGDGTYIMWVTGGIVDPNGCADMAHYTQYGDLCTGNLHAVYYYWSQ